MIVALFCFVMFGLIGLALVVVGIIGIVRAGKKRFERTNRYGVEEFSSFWGMVSAKVVERFAILFVIAGLLTMLCGLIITIGVASQQH